MAREAPCSSLIGEFYPVSVYKLLLMRHGDSLSTIRHRVSGRVRIVLHGTNDFPEDIMKRCVEGGVSKVNVNKLVLDDYLVHLKENASKVALTTLMEQGVEQAQRLTEWQMDVCGSTGRA